MTHETQGYHCIIAHHARWWHTRWRHTMRMHATGSIHGHTIRAIHGAHTRPSGPSRPSRSTRSTRPTRSTRSTRPWAHSLMRAKVGVKWGTAKHRWAPGAAHRSMRSRWATHAMGRSPHSHVPWWSAETARWSWPSEWGSPAEDTNIY